MISVFRREVDENRTLLGCYATSSDNLLPMFRHNILVPSSKITFSRATWLFWKWPLKMVPIGCPETSVRNCHYSLRNNLEERRSYLSINSFVTQQTIDAT